MRLLCPVLSVVCSRRVWRRSDTVVTIVWRSQLYVLLANSATGWPWIFFIEGIITVCFGVLALCFMPHTPLHSKFLTEEERDVALRRMRLDSHGATIQNSVDEERFDWHWVRMALLNPNTWFCSLAWFFLLIPLYVSEIAGTRGRCH